MEYTISNNNLSLTVSSSGAEKVRLISSQGVDYLRTKDQFWNRIAPLLFPIVGKLKDGKTLIENNEYYMNQHGFIRDQEFVVVEKKKDEITLSSKYDNQTLAIFPFKYHVFVTYKLIDKTVETIFQVVNLDDKTISFNYGGHPGFKCPLYENEKFNDYSIIFEKEENFEAPTVMPENGTLNYEETISYPNLKQLKLSWDYFKIDAIVIPQIKSQTVKLINKLNQGIQFDFTGFSTLAIWTKPQASFICLEPWIGHADKHNSNYQFMEKDDLINLEVNNTFTRTYRITILE